MEDQLTPAGIYELVAEVGFKKYFHLGGSEATRALIDLCPIERDSYVLDVGCASGKTACALARTVGCRVVGVDIQPGMVRRARERAREEGVARRVRFTVGDAASLPLASDTFDVVLGEFVTGLVADKEGAVAEYVKVARPGGTIGLNEATWLKTPPPPELVGFLAGSVGFREGLLTSDGWTALLARQGVKALTARTCQAASLSDPREDVKDLVRSLPGVLYALLRRPKFRQFIKASVSVPRDLLDYFGYGLYVGRV